MRFIYRTENAVKGTIYEEFLSAADALKDVRDFRRKCGGRYPEANNMVVRRYLLHSSGNEKATEFITCGDTCGYIDPTDFFTVADTVYRIMFNDEFLRRIPKAYDTEKFYDRLFFDNINAARQERNLINQNYRDNFAFIVQTEVLDLNPIEYDCRYNELAIICGEEYLIAPTFWATI